MNNGAAQNRESFEFYATEHFRMSGVYWGLTAMHLLGRLDDMDGSAILDWVLACAKADGGFGGSERHDSHLLYTLSAVQILALYDALDRADTGRIAACAPRPAICPTASCAGNMPARCDCSLVTADVASLQQADGSFAGDSWGEVDTRCAAGCWCFAAWQLSPSCSCCLTQRHTRAGSPTVR